jgi:hypothetical protein
MSRLIDLDIKTRYLVFVKLNIACEFLILKHKLICLNLNIYTYTTLVYIYNVLKTSALLKYATIK